MKRFASVLALALVAALPVAAVAKHRAATPPPAAAAANPESVSCAAGDPVVWVNASSKVYHLPGSSFYGKTKHGMYLCKSAADKAGDRPAKTAPGKAPHPGVSIPPTPHPKKHKRHKGEMAPMASPNPSAT